MPGKTHEYPPALDRFWPTGPGPKECEAEKAIRAEKDAATAEMAYRYANLAMPEDLRSRAKSWGVEALMEVVWNNAFQSGYREGIRGRGKEGEG